MYIKRKKRKLINIGNHIDSCGSDIGTKEVKNEIIRRIHFHFHKIGEAEYAITKDIMATYFHNKLYDIFNTYNFSFRQNLITHTSIINLLTFECNECVFEKI